MSEFQPLISAELRENWKVFLKINRLAGHSAPLDQAMIFSANRLIFVLPLLLLLAWFVVARWSPWSRWLTTRFGPRVAESDRWLGQRALLSAVVGVGIALSFTILLGALVYEPRPFVSHPALVHRLIAHPANASFPSDHETFSMAIALTLAFYAIWQLRRAARDGVGNGLRRAAPMLVVALVAFGCAVLIGFARVFVGVHYPVDIAGGAVSAAVGDLLAFGLIPLTRHIFSPIVRLATALHLA